MSDWAGTPEQEIETLRKMVEQRDGRIEELEQSLKRQASAAKMGMDAAKKSGAAMYEHGRKMLKESNPEALESERAANAILTNRIEELETMVKVFRACIETRQFPEQGSRCHKIIYELVGESEE